MRTVLACDDLLAKAVRKKLPGEVVELGHIAMRLLGAQAAPRLREMVLEAPCVLAIGGSDWDDVLDTVRDMKLPYRVPIVVLTKPDDEWAIAGRAEALRVFSLVPLIPGASGTVATLSAELQTAWSWVSKRRRPKALRLISRDEAPRLAQPSPGSVFPLYRAE